MPIVLAVEDDTADPVSAAVAAAAAGRRPMRVIDVPEVDEIALEELAVEASVFLEVRIDRVGLLAGLGDLGVATHVWATGRWRFEHRGRSSDAGVAMHARHDPLLTHAMTVLAANKQARLADARATFTRVEVEARAADVVPERVRAWLDARAPEDAALTALAGAIESQGRSRADRDGTDLVVIEEWCCGAVELDSALCARVAAALSAFGPIPALTLPGRYAAAAAHTRGLPSTVLVVAPDASAARVQDAVARVLSVLSASAPE